MIEGERIYLRKINIGDTEKIIEWRNKEFVRRNFIYQEEFTKDIHIKWLKNNVETGNVRQFIIGMKEDNIEIGSVYLRDIDYINMKAEYGIFIGEEKYINKGIGSEVGNSILKYAFEELKLHKVFLRVFDKNLRAINSYKKLGFVQEGYFKEDVKIGDIYYDIIYMGIINKILIS